MSVVDLLLNAQNPDPQIRNNAESVIYGARDNDLAGFLTELVRVAGNEQVPPQARQMALLVLKNSVAFPAKEENAKLILEERWKNIPPPVRSTVRQDVLNTLGSNVREVRHVGALVVANLARIELPRNEWPDLLDQLFAAAKNDDFMEASITTIGYICEESNTSEALGDVLQHRCNDILDCVITGMQKDHPEVCYQATNALVNSITFIHGNMTVEQERDYIMNTVCTNCLNHEPRTIAKALECLVRIAALYYDILQPYMQRLFDITSGAIKNGSEECVLQGFQFWSQVAEVEYEILDDEGGEGCQNYVRMATQHLVPVALSCLLNQEENQTDEDWNACTAAGFCVQRFANVMCDEIVPFVMPFVGSNVSQNGWRNREAATMAFACILEGPTTACLGDTIAQALPALLEQTHPSQHPLVRDTTVWAIARVAMFHAEVIFRAHLDAVITNCLNLMGDDNTVLANKACSVIHNLCVELETDETPQTNHMSKYFSTLVTQVLKCIDRPNANEGNLRGAAQETLNSLLSCAAMDMYGPIKTLIPEFVNRIDRSLSFMRPDTPLPELQEIQLMQGLMAGALQHICRKLGNGITPEEATQVMTALRNILRANQGPPLEEVIMAIGAIASITRENFLQFFEGIVTYLYDGLKCKEESHICIITVGIVGDIVSALGQQTPLQFVEQVMVLLTENIRSDDLPKESRPSIISCFGDIALHLGEGFAKYLDTVMNILGAAASVIKDIDPEDEEMVDLGLEIREAICEAFTGILQGFKNAPNFLLPYINQMLLFVAQNGTAEDVDEKILACCVSVAGDILNVFADPSNRAMCPAEVQSFVRDAAVQGMVQKAEKTNNDDCQSAAEWAREQAEAYFS